MSAVEDLRPGVQAVEAVVAPVEDGRKVEREWRLLVQREGAGQQHRRLLKDPHQQPDEVAGGISKSTTMRCVVSAPPTWLAMPLV